MFCSGFEEENRINLDEDEEIVSVKYQSSSDLVAVLTNQRFRLYHFTNCLEEVTKLDLPPGTIRFKIYSPQSNTDGNPTNFIIFYSTREHVFYQNFSLSSIDKIKEPEHLFTSRYGDVSCVCPFPSKVMIGTSLGYIVSVSLEKGNEDEQIVSPDIFQKKDNFGIHRIKVIGKDMLLVSITSGHVHIFKTSDQNEFYLHFTDVLCLENSIEVRLQRDKKLAILSEDSVKVIQIGNDGNVVHEVVRKLVSLAEEEKKTGQVEEEEEEEEEGENTGRRRNIDSMKFVGKNNLMLSHGKYFSLVDVRYSLKTTTVASFPEPVVSTKYIRDSFLYSFTEDGRIFTVKVYHTQTHQNMCPPLIIHPMEDFLVYDENLGSMIKKSFPIQYMRINAPIRFSRWSPSCKFIAFVGGRGISLFHREMDKFRHFGNYAQERETQVIGLTWIDDQVIVLFNYRNQMLMFYPRNHLDRYSLLHEMKLAVGSYKVEDIKIMQFDGVENLVIIDGKGRSFILNVKVLYNHRNISVKVKLLKDIKFPIPSHAKMSSRRIFVMPGLNIMYLRKDGTLRMFRSKRNDVMKLEDRVEDFYFDRGCGGVKCDRFFFFVVRPDSTMEYLWTDQKRTIQLFVSKPDQGTGRSLPNEDLPTIPCPSQYAIPTSIIIGPSHGYMIHLQSSFERRFGNMGSHRFRVLRKCYLDEQLLFCIIQDEYLQMEDLYSNYDVHMDVLERLITICSRKLGKREHFEKVTRFFRERYKKKVLYQCLTLAFRKSEGKALARLRRFFDLQEVYDYFKDKNYKEASNLLVLMGEEKSDRLTWVQGEAYIMLLAILRGRTKVTREDRETLFHLARFLAKVDSLEHPVTKREKPAFDGWLGDVSFLQTLILNHVSRRWNEDGDVGLMIEMAESLALPLDEYLKRYYKPMEDYRKFKTYFKEIHDEFCIPYPKEIVVRKYTGTAYHVKETQEKELSDCRLIYDDVKRVDKDGEDVSEYMLKAQYHLYSINTVRSKLELVLDTFLKEKVYDWGLLFSVLCLRMKGLRLILEEKTELRLVLANMLKDINQPQYIDLLKNLGLLKDLEEEENRMKVEKEEEEKERKKKKKKLIEKKEIKKREKQTEEEGKGKKEEKKKKKKKEEEDGEEEVEGEGED